MTVVGIGIDVASLARIDRLLRRYGGSFENRWFDPAELSRRGGRSTNAAKSFAVKEAVWKALPHDEATPLPWRSIVARPGEAAHHVDVELRGVVRAEAASRGVTSINATVTVNGDLVVAVAIVQGVRPGDDLTTPTLHASGMPDLGDLAHQYGRLV